MAKPCPADEAGIAWPREPFALSQPLRLEDVGPFWLLVLPLEALQYIHQPHVEGTRTVAPEEVEAPSKVPAMPSISNQ